MANPSMTGGMAQTYEEAAKSLLYLVSSSSKLSHELQEQMRQFQAASGKVGELGKQYNELRNTADAVTNAWVKNKTIQLDLVFQYGRQAKVIRDLKKEYDDLARVQKILDFQTKSTTEKFAAFSNAAGKISSSAIGMVGTITGLGLSYGKLKDTLLEYNRTVYDGMRIGERYGDSLDMYQKSLEKVGRTTSLSKQDFASLNLQVKNMATAMPPTSASIAKLAESMTSKFGPAADVVKQKILELVELQGRLPSIIERVNAAQDAYSRSSKEGAEAAQALYNKLVLVGVSSQDIDKTMAKLKGPSAALQGAGLTNFEQTTSKSRQSLEDSALIIANKVEPAMKAWAETQAAVGRDVAQLPQSILIATGAMSAFGASIGAAALQAAEMLGTIRMMGSVSAGPTLGGGGKWGKIGRGAGAAAALGGAAYLASGYLSSQASKSSDVVLSGGMVGVPSVDKSAKWTHAGIGALSGAATGASIGAMIPVPGAALIGGAIGGAWGGYQGWQQGKKETAAQESVRTQKMADVAAQIKLDKQLEEAAKKASVIEGDDMVRRQMHANTQELEMQLGIYDKTIAAGRKAQELVGAGHMTGALSDAMMRSGLQTQQASVALLGEVTASKFKEFTHGTPDLRKAVFGEGEGKGNITQAMAIEGIKKVQELVEKTNGERDKEGNLTDAAKTKLESLRDIQGLLTDSVTKWAETLANSVVTAYDQIGASMKPLIDMQGQMVALGESRLALAEKLGMPQSYAALKAQVGLVNDTYQSEVKRHAEYAKVTENIARQNGLLVDMKSLENGTKNIEAVRREALESVTGTEEQRAAKNIIVNTTLAEAMKNQVGSLTSMNQLTGKLADLTKTWREGWLNAMEEQVANAGDFAAVIGIGAQNVPQKIAAGPTSTFKYGGTNANRLNDYQLQQSRSQFATRFTDQYGSINGNIQQPTALQQYGNVASMPMDYGQLADAVAKGVRDGSMPVVPTGPASQAGIDAATEAAMRVNGQSKYQPTGGSVPTSADYLRTTVKNLETQQPGGPSRGVFGAPQTVPKFDIAVDKFGNVVDKLGNFLESHSGSTKAASNAGPRTTAAHASGGIIRAAGGGIIRREDGGVAHPLLRDLPVDKQIMAGASVGAFKSTIELLRREVRLAKSAAAEALHLSKNPSELLSAEELLGKPKMTQKELQFLMKIAADNKKARSLATVVKGSLKAVGSAMLEGVPGAAADLVLFENLQNAVVTELGGAGAENEKKLTTQQNEKGFLSGVWHNMLNLGSATAVAAEHVGRQGFKALLPEAMQDVLGIGSGPEPAEYMTKAEMDAIKAKGRVKGLAKKAKKEETDKVSAFWGDAYARGQSRLEEFGGEAKSPTSGITPTQPRRKTAKELFDLRAEEYMANAAKKKKEDDRKAFEARVQADRDKALADQINFYAPHDISKTLAHDPYAEKLASMKREDTAAGRESMLAAGNPSIDGGSSNRLEGKGPASLFDGGSSNRLEGKGPASLFSDNGKASPVRRRANGGSIEAGSYIVKASQAGGAAGIPGVGYVTGGIPGQDSVMFDVMAGGGSPSGTMALLMPGEAIVPPGFADIGKSINEGMTAFEGGGMVDYNAARDISMASATPGGASSGGQFAHTFVIGDDLKGILNLHLDRDYRTGY